MLIYNSTFVNNTAPKFGGGVRNLYSHVTIDSCSFIGNSADNGGAIAYADWNFTGSFLVKNSYFERNIAQSSGGAFYVFSGQFDWMNNECVNNQAKVSGGCIHDITSMLDCDTGFQSQSRLLNSSFIGMYFFSKFAFFFVVACFLFVFVFWSSLCAVCFDFDYSFCFP